jgi:pSer/pThr/pTyr-binding forkhead associated (FHA) protein
VVAAVTVRLAGDAELGVPPDRVFVIGRGRASDLRVQGARVSRRHLLLEPSAGGWDAVDVSGSGTWLDGQQVRRVEIHRECRFRLGAADGAEVIVAPDRTAGAAVARPSDGATWRASADPLEQQATLLARPGASGPPLPASSGEAGAELTHPLRPGRMSIGRSAANDIVVRDLLASRHHADLIVGPGGVEIVDQGSANGTFVNGARVERARLRLDDVVAIGHHCFRFATDRLEERIDSTDATTRMLGDG